MLSTLTQNPIAQAELKYQGHVIENGRAGTLWIILAIVLLVPAAIASLVFFVGGLLNQFIPSGIHILGDELELVLGGLGATLLVAMNLALYLVLTMITLALASNSISREKRGKTWDNLLLTGVDARQIVWGKWWATLAAMRGDHIAAAFLRLGIVTWGVTVLGGEALYQPIIPFLPTMLSYIVAGALLLVGYAVVDAGLTAALGLLIPLTRFDNAAAFVVVFAVRLLLTLTPFVFPYFTFTRFENHFASFYVGFWTVFLVVLTLFTWGVLRLAQWQAVRQHASPPA